MSDLLKRLRELETKLPTSSDNWVEAREVLLEAANCIESSNATAFAAGVEAAAKRADKRRGAITRECDYLSPMDPETGAYECSKRGDCLCQERDEEAEEIAAAIRALSPTPGMVMVPAEPTREMCEAADGLPAIHAIDDLPLAKAGWSMKAIQNLKRYRAMIESARRAHQGA